jgi:beta-lactamase class A
MRELAEQLNKLCDEQPFETYWYVKDLRTGEELDRDGDIVVSSASTRKISIMLATLKQVNDGTLGLDDSFVIEEKYQVRANGAFQYLRPGLEITLYDGIVMMIMVSDNTCTGKIVDIVGLDNINQYCTSIGMKNATHRFNVPPTYKTPLDHPPEATNTTTANDVGHMLSLLIAGTSDLETAARLGLSTELCQLAVEIMIWQMFTAMLPAQLPPEASVAHKTGTGRRMANDAGIIFEKGEPRYVMAVYVDGTPREQRDGPNGQTAAKAHVARLCRTTWDAIVASPASISAS